MSIWSQIEKAVEVCTTGGIIAYPTEYCFGLGCDPLNETAVRRILTLKHRSWAKGLIVITDDVRRLRRLIDFSVGSSLITPLANWPGPHTWLLPALTATPRWLRGQHDTLAVRLIDHPLALALCRQSRSAIVSTSANRKNQPPLRTARQVRFEFGDRIDWIIDGPVGRATSPSEIRDARTGQLVRGGN